MNMKTIMMVLVLMMLIAGCGGKTDVAEPVNNTAPEFAGEPAPALEAEEEVTQAAPALPVCGDGKCHETELDTCEEDCPSCDDSDKCTVDSFDLATLSCRNKPIRDCCGDGFCGPDEECAEDCPEKKTTLASYPYPFVHGDDLEAEIVVGVNCTAKAVAGATAIATGLGIEDTIAGTMGYEIPTIKNKNVIILGNPCTSRHIKQLMPYDKDCLEDYEEGEGRLSMFVTGNKDGKDTYALVVSGYSGDDIRRAAEILGDYERNMAKLKGMETKV